MNEKISLRRIRDIDDDYQLLYKWYQEEEIYLYFEQRQLSYDEVKNKYYPRTLDDSLVVVFMILYEGCPIGIIQYKFIDEEDKKLYGLDDSNGYEIDIFIGELEFHNKKIGRISVELLVNYLFQNTDADIIVMCPLIHNIRAIRCYEGCGFTILRSFYTEDTLGTMREYVLMVRERK